MLLAIAILLIHPQLATTVSLPAEKAVIDASVAITASTSTVGAENSLATPDAPMAVTAPAPIAFVRPPTELRAENRRREFMWKGLVIATSGAATFDAWSSRHAITTAGAVELNPLLKPFAGNGSLYAAMQVGPSLLDFAGKKMMNSRYSWVRRMWWVPQSASFVDSMFCGAHNLAYH